MSATSTSKQPMMADRPFLRVFDLNLHLNDGFNATPSGSALVVADQMNGDGLIIDDIGVISRGTSYSVNLYLSSSNQLFRHGNGNTHGDADLLLRVTCSNTAYETVHCDLPKMLTPSPRVGSEPKNTGLYIPRGYALWAAVDTALPTLADGPNIYLQGGIY